MNNDNLDLLLYGWLAEPDERKAELRFARYFRAAYPEICRYVRSFRADPSASEDIAQRALIKLFVHLGTERKAADGRVREALSNLRPLGFGNLHRRRVERWGERVRGFRNAALTFRVIRETEAGAQRWTAERAEINGRLEPLRAEALHFLDDVPSRTSSDVVGFVCAVRTVRDDLAALAIPSNGLLYTIAKRLFFDSLRGAAAQRSRPLEELNLESTLSEEDREYATAEANREEGDLSPRYRAFLDFLRLPLTRAEARRAQAATAEARAECARVEALAAKYERLLAVLHALHESPQPSEGEIGRRLGLTRNQVKYVIERIREEFTRFSPDVLRTARH